MPKIIGLLQKVNDKNPKIYFLSSFKNYLMKTEILTFWLTALPSLSFIIIFKTNEVNNREYLELRI